MKNIIYFLIVGMFYSCMDAQEKQLLGKWNVEEVKDIEQKKIIPGHDYYIEFLGNGKIKMNDSEGSYKKGVILVEMDKKLTTFKVDSISDYLYFSVFTDDKKNGEMILSKNGSKHPESDKEEAYDFRNVKWGMNMEQVLASEKGEIRSWENDRVRVPSTLVAGLESSISYCFFQDTLICAIVNIKEEYSSESQYIEDYCKLVEALNSKYGEGNSQSYRRISLFGGDVDNYGMGMMRHLTHYTTWDVDGTKIELVLNGGNDEMGLRLKYFSKKYEHLRLKVQQVPDTTGL